MKTFGPQLRHSAKISDQMMRTREAFVAGGESNGAVATALRQTAAAATGAGLVMAAALIGRPAHQTGAPQ